MITVSSRWPPWLKSWIPWSRTTLGNCGANERCECLTQKWVFQTSTDANGDIELYKVLRLLWNEQVSVSTIHFYVCRCHTFVNNKVDPDGLQTIECTVSAWRYTKCVRRGRIGGAPKYLHEGLAPKGCLWMVSSSSVSKQILQRIWHSC